MLLARSTLAGGCLVRSSIAVSLLAALCASGCIKRSADCVPQNAAPPAPAAPNDAAAPLPPSTPLLAASGVEAFALVGDATRASLSAAAVGGQPFARVVRAQVKAPSGSEWTVQMQAKTTAAVQSGDALLATFYVRAVEPQDNGVTESQFVFERAAPPYTKSVSYSFRITPQWRKVQVRFNAAESYAAGEAQMIFRLGYDPEQFELGGVTVENFGPSVKLSALPSSELADRRLLAQATAPEPPLTVIDGGELPLSVNPSRVIRPISPYVYGINAQHLAGSGATLRRLGGNRGSAYNWENNASNAGSDYQHVNDEWTCSVMGYENCSEPGAQYLNFVQDSKREGAEAIVTVTMQDYVSADKNGDVKEEEKAPSKRFVKSLPRKPGPLSLKPDLDDGVVYQDEFVHLLLSKLGPAARGGAKFYSLDNEPALWPVTHPRIHPAAATYREIVQRSEATASAILDVDPSAFVLGGVAFGWSEYVNFANAPDAAEFNERYGTYLDYFLASMKQLGAKRGRRLVHALDLHWYPEARGSTRVTEADVSRKTMVARLQAPRSLWDAEYKEKSWISDQLNEPIRLLPRINEIIAKRYPGTKLALTEYNFGAGNHISGGLAQADVLGVLGREGVYIANYWGDGAGNGELPPYILAAFKLYRNYDGKGGHFGDNAVAAKSADNAAASIFAATDTKTGALTILIINKDLQKSYTAKLRLDSGKYTRADSYVLDRNAATIEPGPTLTIRANQLEHALPPLSATLFVCKK